LGEISVARKKAAGTGSVGDTLEKALVKDPDDLGAHAAYADWLTQQGDPRGEFIQVQLALEEPGRSATDRKQLQKREKELLQKHQRDWLGNLARFFLHKEGVPDYLKDQVSHQFSRGWLNTLVIPLLTGDLAWTLAKATQTRLVRNLCILDVAVFVAEDWDDDAEVDHDQMQEDYPGLGPLTKSPYLGNLRFFQLGNQHEVGNDDYLYDSLRAPYIGLDVLWMIQKMPKVEELYLNLYNSIDGKELFGLRSLTRLRVLQFCLGDSYPLRVLAENAAMGQLTHLLLHPQAVEEGKKAYITRAGVRALVRSRHLPHLTHLALHQTDMGDEGCTEIVRSGILDRLEVLDVSYGSITDAGARILAACPDLAYVEFLNVSQNALTKKGIAALEAVGIEVRADTQHDPDDDSYLYQGDWE
jgi:uncharacterized protein (TIGR02996 family)